MTVEPIEHAGVFLGYVRRRPGQPVTAADLITDAVPFGAFEAARAIEAREAARQLADPDEARP